MDAELVGMSFSIAENETFYVPVPADQGRSKLKIVNEFRLVTENETSLKVGQNIKYDMIASSKLWSASKRPVVRYNDRPLCSSNPNSVTEWDYLC